VIDRSRQDSGFPDTAQRAAHTAGMPVRLHHIVVDAHDLPSPARFWTQAPGWKVLSGRENEIVIGTGQNAAAGVCFMPVTDPRTIKNRVHLDLTSSAADRDQEIDRLLALGARRAGIGQTGAESWTVLADPGGKRVLRSAPEGNAHPMRLSTENRRQTLSAACADIRPERGGA
jgi:hypothetical protein